MGTVVCQSCDGPIARFEAEKVQILYANKNECVQCNGTERKK